MKYFGGKEMRLFGKFYSLYPYCPYYKEELTVFFRHRRILMNYLVVNLAVADIIY